MTGAGAGSGFGFGRGDRIGFGFAARPFSAPVSVVPPIVGKESVSSPGAGKRSMVMARNREVGASASATAKESGAGSSTTIR